MGASRRGTTARAWAAAAAGALAACAAGPRGRSPPRFGWDHWPWMTTEVARGRATFVGALVEAGPGQREARLAVESAGPDTAVVRYGTCSFGLRLYRDSALAAPPAWDDRLGPGDACPAVGLELRVPPGAARPLAARRLDLGALRRAVPAGRYHVAVTLRPGRPGPVRAVRAGAVTIGGRD